MSIKLKQLGIKCALGILRGLEGIAKPFFYLGNVLFVRPLSAFGLFLYRAIILNIYQWIVRSAHAMERLVVPIKNKYIYPFAHRYFTHAIIIILASTVVYTNVYAQETRSREFGERSVLFTLVRDTLGEQGSLIEESSVPTPISPSYTDAHTTTVSRQITIIPDGDHDVIEDRITTTQGGTALLKPDVSSIAASQLVRTSTVEYVVKEGDTIGTIAQQFNVSANTILWANGLTSRQLIRIGQTLKIPPIDGIIVTIAKGDTLKSIATKYKGNVDAIVAFNRLVDASDIAVGQQIMIPGGQQYVPPAPPRPATPRPPTVALSDAPSAGTSGYMLWPTTARRISQYFSWRHSGLDIDGDFGDPVWAADDGVVTTAHCQRTGYGCHVIIDHGGGKHTLYAHFQKILVEVGQSVKRGQLIGEEGSTGMSTGAHVHFEVRINGVRYNPLSYIR